MAMLEKLQGARTFTEESWAELHRVTWPDWPQLKNATIVIIIFVILISGVIWLMDITVRNILNFVMGLFGA
jgi:preprotein translocase subunit SecE